MVFNLLIDFWVVFSFWLLGMKRLWTFLYTAFFRVWPYISISLGYILGCGIARVVGLVYIELDRKLPVCFQCGGAICYTCISNLWTLLHGLSVVWYYKYFKCQPFWWVGNSTILILMYILLMFLMIRSTFSCAYWPFTVCEVSIQIFYPSWIVWLCIIDL